MLVAVCWWGETKWQVRTDHHQKFLCDYNEKFISHCKKEDYYCTEPELNHFGYEHDKCRFGFRKIKCTDKVWLGCVVVIQALAAAYAVIRTSKECTKKMML